MRPPLEDGIRSLALEGGFHACGFARAGEAAHAERFREWLARGHAGSLAYMERAPERRTDPRRIIPGARSVIALALRYGAPGERASSSLDESRATAESGRGEISRYARGLDYHRVMERRLRRLSRALRERHPGERFHWYVDTGPVLERSWAEAAGLGWIGKNACAIDPVAGSYFFIAVILTTLELAPDPPSAGDCGSCTLCLDACPTEAIVGPQQVDARRCISYLTIEQRGEIPAELREALGGMVFGCDICQEVCPFNRPGRSAGGPAGDAELAPRPENEDPPLAELLALAPESFRPRFRASAVKRAGWGKLLRNAILAAGNSGRRDLLAPLRAVGEREEVRGDAVISGALRWALERLESIPGV